MSLHWSIATYTTWDNGHIKWKKLRVCNENNTITATVCGEFWRGLYASLTIKTYKKLKYADTVRKLKNRREEAVGERNTKTALLEKYRQQEKEYSNDIHLLQEYIEHKNHEKKHLSSNYMSLEEAERRLQLRVSES